MSDRAWAELARTAAYVENRLPESLKSRWINCILKQGEENESCP